MTRIWAASDHHFRHKNILRFTNQKGELIRGKVFESIDDHDNKIVEWHNELVKPQDHVYFLGDVAINKGGLEFVKKMNGHKRLVRGNHDIFDDELYHESGLKKIYGVRVWPKHNLIFSHIPLHPECLKSRNWKNIHGHLHDNIVVKHLGWDSIKDDWITEPDNMYRCVSLEQTDYRPVLIME